MAKFILLGVIGMGLTQNSWNAPPVIEDGFADEKEIEIFLSETQKVKNFTSFGDPYVCNPHVCMKTSFTAGLQRDIPK